MFYITQGSQFKYTEDLVTQYMYIATSHGTVQCWP